MQDENSNRYFKSIFEYRDDLLGVAEKWIEIKFHFGTTVMMAIFIITTECFIRSRQRGTMADDYFVRIPSSNILSGFVHCTLHWCICNKLPPQIVSSKLIHRFSMVFNEMVKIYWVSRVRLVSDLFLWVNFILEFHMRLVTCGFVEVKTITHVPMKVKWIKNVIDRSNNNLKLIFK